METKISDGKKINILIILLIISLFFSFRGCLVENKLKSQIINFEKRIDTTIVKVEKLNGIVEKNFLKTWEILFLKEKEKYLKEIEELLKKYKKDLKNEQ